MSYMCARTISEQIQHVFNRIQQHFGVRFGINLFEQGIQHYLT